ncbi:DEAD/DEAH box helicase [Frondihabitans cladoniiphilus]|uniref:DEAD/DEAH box helicase n=1 Tax=Frondihabitans cladoniiphilus TaxID=715785 RepID=A0ABP8VQR9_9MICO
MPEVAPLVDATDIIRLVGPGSFSRAKEYVRAGRVLESAWNPSDGVLTGTVQGSGPFPYRCRVALVPGRGDYRVPRQGSCTCPLTQNCKHVAATILQSNSAAVQAASAAQAASPASAASSPSGGPDLDGTSAAAGDGSDWRTSLAGLTGSASPVDARAARMGLYFELREQLRAARGRWEAPKWRTVSAGRVSPDGRFRLGVRPVTLSATNNWVRGGLTWSTLPYQQNRLEMSADHHRWFGQFAALHKSARDNFLPTEEGDWLALDRFASPLLWPLLAEGARLGITFVTGKRETDVTVARSARVTLDLRHADDGGVRVGAGLVIDGAVHPPLACVPGGERAASAAARPEVIGVTGDHGVYVWRADPAPHVLMAPTIEPVRDEQKKMLVGGSEIVVPPTERDAFLTEFYPRLVRSVAVVSGDSSIELPEVLPPRLTLTATYSPGDELDLHWAWRGAGQVEPVGAYEIPAAVRAAVDGELGDRHLKGVVAAEWSASILPSLESLDDLDVVVVGDKPDYRELSGAPALTVTTVETDKRDWFDLGVLVTVDGRTVPFGPLFTALSKKRPKLLLPDKSYLSLLHPAFDELRRLIEEAETLDEWEAGLRINRYQASLWSEFEELADATVQADSWRASVGGLLELAGRLEGESSIPVPSTVRATLRPYQIEGFSWLAFLYDHGLGGVLADDMGLGKTLQTLALFAHAVGASPVGGDARDAPADVSGTPTPRPPFLVVAPTSVVSNWVAEAARFTPDLVVRGVTATEGKTGGTLASLAEGADVIVTSYALFRLDFAAYQRLGWAGLILDEAQFIKNRSSKAHRCAVDLDTPFKLAITGTPLENSLVDLWSLFRVVSPGLLSTGLKFTEDYVKPIAAGGRPELMQTLRRRIRPFLLRRTKERVAADLPEKQEQVLRVDLDPAHRELYDMFLQRERQKLLGLVDDLDRHRFIVFRSLTLLRLLSLDAGLVDEAYDHVPSAKMDALLDELDDVVAGGHRALVFSQFTSYLSRVAARLTERGIDHEYLDGSTLHRADVIARFKEGTAPAFLISLKAGGFGLNLTEADYVFLLDPWWNPATESQAVDRTHRIGQTKNVMVYRMIANDTIEEKVMALQQQKAQLFDAVMDDDEAAFGTALTADDIRGLLEA